MDNKALAHSILRAVGGAENVKTVAHCMTRLRFVLKDDSKADLEDVKALDGVMGAVTQGGQFQVILGGEVVKTYREIEKEYPRLAEGEVDEAPDPDGKKQGWFTRLMQLLSGILVPTLPPIIGGGMLKGFLFFFTTMGWMDPAGSLYFVLNIAGDAMFYFFPFLLAVSSAKKFRTNNMMALAMAGALMYPSLINGAAEGMEALKLFGFLPVPVLSYASSVIPIILAVWIMSYVYRFLEKHIPAMVNVIFTPLLTLVIMVPVALVALAPLGYYVGEYIGYGLDWLVNLAPWLAGFVIAATRPFLVLAGMHHAIRPLMQQQIATFGYSTIAPFNFLSTMAQATAVFACFVILKDKKMKQVSASATIPGFLGITEPALYGIITQYKAAMVGTFIGGGLGGLVAGAMQARAYAFVMPSILTLPVFAGGGWASILLPLVVTVVSTFVITFLLSKTVMRKEKATINAEQVAAMQAGAIGGGNAKPTAKAEVLLCPVNGNVYAVADVADAAFAAETFGKGAALMPSDGRVVAPADGLVENLFTTKHALGLVTDAGAEVLVHIGLNTVQLEGKHFIAHCGSGQRVKKGDLLVEFDLEALKAEGYDPTVMVVVTNTAGYQSVQPSFTSGPIFQGEALLALQ